MLPVIYAILCRQWDLRVKGRYWYDWLWFQARNTPLNLFYLEEKMRQTGHYQKKESLQLSQLKELLHKKIEELDLSRAKSDVLAFIKMPQLIEGWSKETFHAAVEQLHE